MNTEIGIFIFGIIVGIFITLFGILIFASIGNDKELNDE